MKEVTNTYYDENAVDNTVNSLDRIVLAVIVTGLLYAFNIGWNHSEPTTPISDSGTSSVTLSEVTAQKVLREVSADSGLPESDLQIVEMAAQVEEPGVCNGGNSAIACTHAEEAPVQIIVASKQQRWVYRLNQSGSHVQIEKVSTSSAQ